MKKYVYFVSYSHERGFGNIEITQDMEMTEFDHIRGVEQVIKDISKSNQPIVISYQLLKTFNS